MIYILIIITINQYNETHTTSQHNISNK